MNAVRFARDIAQTGAPGEIRTPDPQIRSLVPTPLAGRSVEPLAGWRFILEFICGAVTGVGSDGIERDFLDQSRIVDVAGAVNAFRQRAQAQPVIRRRPQQFGARHGSCRRTLRRALP